MEWDTASWWLGAFFFGAAVEVPSTNSNKLFEMSQGWILLLARDEPMVS